MFRLELYEKKRFLLRCHVQERELGDAIAIALKQINVFKATRGRLTDIETAGVIWDSDEAPKRAPVEEAPSA